MKDAFDNPEDASNPPVSPRAQAEDIAMMRRRIAALIRDPGADPDLINRTMKVLCRMMEIQRRYRFG